MDTRILSSMIPLRITGTFILLLLSTAMAVAEEECTTAIVLGAVTPDGRPLLWKNRDTDQLSNKVVFVSETPHRYLAVVNANDSSGRVAWGGVNDAGFAIINSVAYNLPKKSGELADLEGHVMADALRTCATVDDFELYLKRHIGPDLGCWTNFAVIDARGGAAIFEVHNHGYARIAADTASGGCLLNTNFSRSGKADRGAGYLRFDRERALFNLPPGEKISRDFILQRASRDLGHSLLNHPAPAEWKTFPPETPVWIHTNHTINRISTASSILIQGAKPGEDPSAATLWVILGEPVCSIALPFWVAAGKTPEAVRTGADAPVTSEAMRLRKLLHPLTGNDREEYADLTRLDNSAGTGWLPRLLAAEREIMASADSLMATRPGAAERADFQEEMAEKALRTLRGVK